MSRGKKLIVVGAVMLVGMILAWPFRKTGQEASSASLAVLTQQPDNATMFTESTPAENSPVIIGSPQPHVVAKMTSTGDVAESASSHAQPSTSFDLANHPALLEGQTTINNSPVTPPVPPTFVADSSADNYAAPSQPAYNTPLRKQRRRIEEVRHVVGISDTLEKLAKRYLGDESRALEIFDLNRDVLDNPHLLPIDAELRLPEDARLTAD